MKKGQATIGHIFIYILAIFIFALILLYGYKAIVQFMEKGEQVSLIQFKTTLQTNVQDLAIQYGDVIVFNENNPLKAPSRYKEICFVADDAVEQQLPTDERYDIMRAAVDADMHKSTENVFLIPQAEHSIYVGPIELGDYGELPYLCINFTKNLLNIRLEGRGDKTRISRI